ncbi:chemotaxis protein CheA [Erwinia sp. CPCC 100877]|nr:chemotaxis protein CheA [Erwinia sp. CPCC 100877]
MDISDFYQTFFDEADELLADMEQHLLELDPQMPDRELMNAIFRSAHSIKGGAGTFGFSVLQETTHLLENLLDEARCGELALNSDIINLFLETKDIMHDQLESYKSSQEPDAASFESICQALRELALENKAAKEDKAPEVAEPAAPEASVAGAVDQTRLQVTLSKLKDNESSLLLDELGNLGTVAAHRVQDDSLIVTLDTQTPADDIIAVMCFIVEPDQIAVAPAEGEVAKPAEAQSEKPQPVEKRPEAAPPRTPAARPQRGAAQESSSIRVAVEKVDQIINQVGELIITQSMLSQLSGSLDPAISGDLLNSIGQLERNARDLQESVMSIRMMPMEYVFSRFPRLVRDLAGKLQKQVELTLHGGSAELDKSLIERIIDPLTHLVRNSIDHGIEDAETRLAKGKSARGNLILSAEHQGGNIVIEVIDDGAGLNREKILARAISQGMDVSENISDEEVWMLIFAPGFSTAEKVTDVSGRGVGMDVVKRNIQDMGGYVEIHSEKDKGSTIRIILPLTLAILDGMSVRVGEETFILPLNAVMESLQPQEKALHPMAGGELMLQVREEYLPLIQLHEVLNIDHAQTEPGKGIAVILQSAGRRYALLVDQLIGQHQVVVKNLEMNYRKVPGISAATILGDGSVALIVDVAALPLLCRDKRIAGVIA